MESYLNFFISIGLRLIRPSSNISKPEERRRARLLSGILVVYLMIMFLLLIFLVFFTLRLVPRDWTGVISTSTATIIYIGCYFLSRSRYYRTAAFLFVVSMNLAIFSNIFINNANNQAMLYALPYSAISFVILSLFTHPKWVTANYFMICIFFLTGYLLKPEIPYETWILEIIFITLSFLVSAVGAMIRDADLRQIDSERMRYFQSSKLASLGEMAGGIAHEINNPLTVIKGHAAKLKKALNSEEIKPSEEFNTSVQKIDQFTDRIAKILQGMTRLTRNTTRDQRELMSLTGQIEDLKAISSERLRSLGITLSIESTPELKLFGYPSQIGQILLNLLNNAVDAVSGLDNKWIKIEFLVENGNLKIMLTDSGNGIAADTIERLMQPFFTTKPPGKGTGLGLSISKAIAEDHKGRLYYDSQCKNTRFVLELPLAESLS